MESREGKGESKETTPSTKFSETFAKIIPGHTTEFSNLLMKHLARVPFNMLLFSWNHPWGNGEFFHNFNFTNYYRRIVDEQKDINMQSLCFVSPDKLKLIELILSDKFKPEEIYYYHDEKEEFNVEKAKHSKYIICISIEPTVRIEQIIKGTFTTLTHRTFSDYIQNFNNQINISRGNLDEGDLMFIMASAPSYTFIQSCCELGVRPSFRRNHPKVLHSSGMGVNPEDKENLGYAQDGIKFFDEIIEYSARIYGDSVKDLKADTHKSPEEISRSKALVIAEDGVPKVFEHLVAEKKEEKEKIEALQAFFENNTIVFGYLQQRIPFDPEEIYENFFSATLGLREKPFTTFFTNQQMIDAIDKLLASPVFLKRLKENGVGKIILPNRTITIDPDNPRQINLVNTAGISQKEKNKLIAVSDFTAGSGDDSYSAVFSLGRLPFFQPRLWKIPFFAGMLNDIKKNYPTLDVLHDYIKICIASTRALGRSDYEEYIKLGGPTCIADDKIFTENLKNPNELLEFYKINHAKLQEQFRQYCAYAYKQHNIKDEMNNLLFRAFVSSILFRGTPEEIDQLLDIQPTWEMGKHNFNFVYFAAAYGKLSLLIQLYKKNPDLFKRLLMTQHLKLKDTPYDLCKQNLPTDELINFVKEDFVLIAKTREEITKLLDSNPTWETSQGNFVLYAIMDTNLSMLQQLYESNRSLFFDFLLQPYAHPLIPVNLCELFLSPESMANNLTTYLEHPFGKTMISSALHGLIGSDNFILMITFEKLSKNDRRKEIDWNIRNKLGDTPLLSAAKKGLWDPISCILVYGNNISHVAEAINIFLNSGKCSQKLFNHIIKYACDQIKVGITDKERLELINLLESQSKFPSDDTQSRLLKKTKESLLKKQAATSSPGQFSVFTSSSSTSSSGSRVVDSKAPKKPGAKGSE